MQGAAAWRQTPGLPKQSARLFDATLARSPASARRSERRVRAVGAIGSHATQHSQRDSRVGDDAVEATGPLASFGRLRSATRGARVCQGRPPWCWSCAYVRRGQRAVNRVADSPTGHYGPDRTPFVGPPRVRVGGGYGSRSKVAARAVGSDGGLVGDGWLGGRAAVVAEPSGARRSGDGRGALATAPFPSTHARSAGHAAAASLLAGCRSAANTAGALRPSAECGRRWL
jgi:hypothetical protein